MMIRERSSERSSAISVLLIGLSLILPLFMLGCTRGLRTDPRTIMVAIPTATSTTVPPSPTPSATAAFAPSQATPTASTATLTTTSTIAPGPDSRDVVTHVVQDGEVLGGIALAYDVSVNVLMTTNGLIDPDLIWAGDVLTVPTRQAVALSLAPTFTPVAAAVVTPMPASVVTATERVWEPAILDRDLDAAYPASQTIDPFTIHYTPGTYPETDLDYVVYMLQKGFAHLEATFDTTLEGQFDVYVAGSLFAPPDQALRGRSFSAARRIFFLYDGTGNPQDQQYIATHEMTHLFAWNAFGRPVSAMLSEGAAVYAGMALLDDSQHLPINDFCAAYRQAGVLPTVSTYLTFEGHIRDLPNYYAAGCFVGYLVDTYGPEPFTSLYPTGDYAGVYGKSLSTLESEWLSSVDTYSATVAVDPSDLIAAVDAVSSAYEQLFSVFSRTTSQYAAYLEIDAARIALLEARFNDVWIHLDAMRAALNM